MRFLVAICTVIFLNVNFVIGQCTPVIPQFSHIADTTLINGGNEFDVWVCKNIQVEFDGYGNSIYVEEDALIQIIGMGQTIWVKKGATVFLLSEGNTVYYDTNAIVKNNAPNNTLIPCPNMTFDYSIAPANGCDVNTQVEEFSNSNRIRVYPNPNNGNFNIESVAIDGDRANLIIYNIQGQEIYQTYFLGLDDIQLNLSQELSNGVYFLKITGEEINLSQNIVVKK